MRRKTELRLAALLIALAMLLSGCGGGSTIEDDPIDEEELQAHLQEADYVREGYYAPSTSMDEKAPVAPAPAPATIEQMREAERERMTEASYEQASVYTNFSKGDMNIGIVVTDIESLMLNPLRCTYVDVLNLDTLVFESLVALDANQQPINMLADRWERSGDTWTFYLRNNVYFQDGTPLSANDVLASYQELLKNPSSFWYPMLFQYVEGLRVKNETTIQVRGKNGYAGYMLLYAMTFPIVQETSMDNTMPLGTGPYVLLDYDTNAVLLQANPNWWRNATDSVKTIVGLFYPTAKLAVAALNDGEIDSLASEYPTVSVNRNLNDRVTMDYFTTTYECIVPNLNNPILNDLSVRQAMMYAIDRTTLGKTVYTGMVRESEVPVVPGTWLYEAQAAKYNYNPQRALMILQEAGWTDPDNDGILQNEIGNVITTLTLKLITYDRGTTSTRSEAVEAIAAQLQKVGFDIRIEKLTASKARENMEKGEFDLCLAAFELGETPNLFFMLNSGSNTNYSRYKNDEMDRLLRAAYSAKSPEDLVANMRKVQIKIVEDLPIFGLFFRTGMLVSGPQLNGLPGTRRGYALNGIATVTLKK